MKRAVIDTTVLVSAFLTEEGVSAKLLQKARGGACVVCLSAEIIEEMRRRLLEPSRMRLRYNYSDERVETQCRDLALTAELISDLPDVHAVEHDPTWLSQPLSKPTAITSSRGTRICCRSVCTREFR